ncbi:hypothetical protein [Vibrio sp. HN007]|uniref:hypothetical protein n=1 Tax=Vibrio iocasae TaxID=3098914 RepID=UPI0035D3E3C9
MIKIFLPLLLVTFLSGCSIIALPFKAVGAVGDIISKNDTKEEYLDIQMTALAANPEVKSTEQQDSIAALSSF